MRTLATKQPSTESSRAKRRAHAPVSRVRTPPAHQAPILQRKAGCACGGGCPRCQENELALQTKLKIGKPGDKYEQEADRVAGQVMKMSESVSPVTATLGNTLQRQFVEEEDEELIQTKAVSRQTPVLSTQSEAQIHQLRGGGQPLSVESRQFYESRFGHSFAQVRIHNDSRSAQLAQALNARAFTVGKDIVFDNGEYRPNSTSGQYLLTHELTHVVQQGAAHPQRAPKDPPSFQHTSAPEQIQRVLRPACATHMTVVGNNPVCNKPPRPGVVGSKVHAEIGRTFRAASPGNHITELPIPAAPKSSVHSDSSPVIPKGVPVVGKVDLVKIVSNGPHTVRIQIGEIKPMKYSSFAQGVAELLYYRTKIEEAQDICRVYKRDFLEGLEQRLGKLPPKQAAKKRKQAMKEAARSLASHHFCNKLDAVGPPGQPAKQVTLAKKYGVAVPARRFSMTLGGRSRQMLVRTCDDGVICYRCLEKPKKKKKQKKQKKQKTQKRAKSKSESPKSQNKAAKRKAKRAARAAEKQAKRQLRKEGVKRVARKTIAKTAAKVAGRIALKAVPVVGWVLLAVDIAEATYGLYNLFKYGIGDGSGSGGPDSGEAGKTGSESGGQAGGGEARSSQVEGAEGGSETGVAGGTSATGSHSGEGGQGEGQSDQGVPGGTTAAGEGESDVGGRTGGQPAGTAASEGSHEGKQVLTQDADAVIDETLKQMGIFDSEEDAVDFAESLPLSQALLDALKNSTPEQQQLLELMLSNNRAEGQPQVTEEFFVKILEITQQMTAAELETLDQHMVPVTSETLEEILQRLETALKAIREGRPLSSSDDTESDEARDKAATPDDEDGKQGEGKKGEGKKGDAKTGGGTKAGSGGKKATPDGKGSKPKKGSGGSAKEGDGENVDVLVAQNPPADAKRDSQNIFGFKILSGLERDGKYSGGNSYNCTIRINDQGSEFVVKNVSITYIGKSTAERKVDNVNYVFVDFDLYFTEDFWVKERQFLGLGGSENKRAYEFNGRPKKK